MDFSALFCREYSGQSDLRHSDSHSWSGLVSAGLCRRRKSPNQATSMRLARLGVLLLTVLVSFFGLFQLASLAKNLGLIGVATLGPLGFLGNFLFQVGDIVSIITPALGGLAAGGALSSFMGRLGQRSSRKTVSWRCQRSSTLFSPPLAGAVTFGLIGQLVEWLYQIGQPLYTLWGPVLTGSLLGLALASSPKPKTPCPPAW